MYTKFKEYIFGSNIIDRENIEIDISDNGVPVIAFHNIYDINGKYIVICSDGKNVWEMYTRKEINNKSLRDKILKFYHYACLKHKKEIDKYKKHTT